MRFLVSALLAASAAPAYGQFPGAEWPTGTPESQGLSSAHLDALAAFAEVGRQVGVLK